ncbi:Mu transposase C-terminal domain-containing protein [Nonomuraea basaltis]|uniref:Mu transposase C-terminal domain-containing protein n=1 Tax=Nonomuraea basaltis TaxID=2495887 RepID=UPI00110C3EF8|nr:Mu transposase C-terminal domain-containing protein [Nonomuraea basaltis]TMR88812.1 DDE-type integrase/transposase/recombinase [Nonomuraea basaltis]
MGMAKPEALRVSDRVTFEGRAQTVVGLSGTVVRLADEHGQVSVVQLVHLLASSGFEHLGKSAPTPLLPAGMLTGLPQEVVEEAMWWHQHIVEVLTGLLPGAPAASLARPEYDPATRQLTEREQAKGLELRELMGEEISEHTVRRKRRRYEARGLVGLVDGRYQPSRSIYGRTDPRVLAAVGVALEEATDRSTRTVSYLHWRVEQLLVAEHGAGVVVMPARATFYRLFKRLGAGRHTTGSARTRRSLANQPDEAFGEMTASRPGELMEIDSTPFDVLVRLDDGVVGRVELTGMVDLATRTITAAVLRPTTTSLDASLLLARTVTPEPMRPGWSEAVSMARSVLPHRRLLELDERLAHAAARPVIVPETIVCDRGKVFISNNFRTACASLGINFQPAHQDTPTDKPHIERTLGSVSTMFAQFVSGYVGRSAEHRGRKVEDEPLWSLPELQEFLDEWIVARWQNRPHDGLRDPSSPGRTFTPNEKYAALVEAAGYVPVALSAEDYIELLPATWRVINTYGIKINHRIYDSEELVPFRRQPSGVKDKKDLWEIHYDRYDIGRIWVRNHWDGGWITVFWRHLNSAPAPFGEVAWDHSRRDLLDQGREATEAEIADAVATLLNKAHQGPLPAAETGKSGRKKKSARSKRDQQVVARTAATAKPSWPRPPELAPEPVGQVADDTGVIEPGKSEELAEVVPLRVFDAREEAKKWW